MKLKHIILSQESQENVTYGVLENLKKLIPLDLDETSQIKGNLKSEHSYKDTADLLQETFPELTITYEDRLLRFKDNPELLGYLLGNQDQDSDGAIGLEDLSKIKNLVLPSEITNLSESEEYPNILLLIRDSLEILEGGTSLSGDIDVSSNSSVTSIDMSGTGTSNISGLADKLSLQTLKYHTPTKIEISECQSLNISE